MIRVNYPLSPLAHLRLRLELATRRTRRALQERRRALREESADQRTAREEEIRQRRVQECVRERSVFATFFDQYDALIGLLCTAAHEGLKPAMEVEYRTRRAWFCAQYPNLRRLLQPHLNAAGPQETGRPSRRVDDPFEGLFKAPTIKATLAEDGGSLIPRLLRTQAALDAWDESLRSRQQALGAS